MFRRGARRSTDRARGRLRRRRRGQRSCPRHPRPPAAARAVAQNETPAEQDAHLEATREVKELAEGIALAEDSLAMADPRQRLGAVSTLHGKRPPDVRGAARTDRRVGAARAEVLSRGGRGAKPEAAERAAKAAESQQERTDKPAMAVAAARPAATSTAAAAAKPAMAVARLARPRRGGGGAAGSSTCRGGEACDGGGICSACGRRGQALRIKRRRCPGGRRWRRRRRRGCRAHAAL